jgi:hypothetical protein
LLLQCNASRLAANSGDYCYCSCSMTELLPNGSRVITLSRVWDCGPETQGQQGLQLVLLSTLTHIHSVNMHRHNAAVKQTNDNIQRLGSKPAAAHSEYVCSHSQHTAADLSIHRTYSITQLRQCCLQLRTKRITSNYNTRSLTKANRCNKLLQLQPLHHNSNTPRQQEPCKLQLSA